jgi:hypothetical protein
MKPPPPLSRKIMRRRQLFRRKAPKPLTLTQLQARDDAPRVSAAYYQDTLPPWIWKKPEDPKRN